MHGERAGRARRQHLAGGNRDGGENACRLLSRANAHRHHADRSVVAHGVADHGLRGPAEQGRGGCQRVCACFGHPSGRRAQGTADLRNHARRGRRLDHQPDRAGETLRAQRLQAAAQGTGHRARLGRGLQQGIPAVQGSCGQEGRDLRRRPACAGHRRGAPFAPRALAAAAHVAGEQHGRTPECHGRSVCRRRRKARGIRGRRPGGRDVQGDRAGCPERRRARALFRQCRYPGHRVPGRGHRAPVQGRAHRQRRRR